MLHESPRPAACRHVLHLLHILDPYEPNCRQSSEMVPHPGILDDMTPPPRPCIPMQGFWHFPAKKEGTRFYRHAENFFKLPPCHSPRQTKTRTDSLLWPNMSLRCQTTDQLQTSAALPSAAPGIRLHVSGSGTAWHRRPQFALFLSRQASGRKICPSNHQRI